MKKLIRYIVPILCLALLFGCKKNKEVINYRNSLKDEKIAPPQGMVYIPGGTYMMGASRTDELARTDEKPAHLVSIDGFFMDATEVTNKQFQQFVDNTGYTTVAERNVVWEEMKKQLPKNTPKPHDSLLQAGSLSFHCHSTKVENLTDYSQWWQWKTGANWRHPMGPSSSIKNKEQHPVVHIAYEDAVAYCKWAKKRLPTEAEWEWAARGGLKDKVYSWGNDHTLLNNSANTWQGVFPTMNTLADGYSRSSPVSSYAPNDYGLYDMLGNVWEWTQDWYAPYQHEKMNKYDAIKNPKGSQKFTKEPLDNKVIRGGSFLCHDSYCASFRVSARMFTSFDTGLEHVGFRTVKSLNTN